MTKIVNQSSVAWHNLKQQFYHFNREDKAKFEFTWNGVEIGSIDRSQFLINFAV